MSFQINVEDAPHAGQSNERQYLRLFQGCSRAARGRLTSDQVVTPPGFASCSTLRWPPGRRAGRLWACDCWYWAAPDSWDGRWWTRRSRGWDVTVFNRGVSGRPPEGVTALRGDRTVPGGLAPLAGRSWDAAIYLGGCPTRGAGQRADRGAGRRPLRLRVEPIGVPVASDGRDAGGRAAGARVAGGGRGLLQRAEGGRGGRRPRGVRGAGAARAGRTGPGALRGRRPIAVVALAARAGRHGDGTRAPAPGTCRSSTSMPATSPTGC